MASLDDFINPDLSKSDVAHSHGFARAASGGALGASGSGLSMEQRRKLARERQAVGSYMHSQLGRRRGTTKARTAGQKHGRVYDPTADSFGDKATFSNRHSTSVKDSSKVDPSIQRRQRFIEPPKRNYNPYK